MKIIMGYDGYLLYQPETTDLTWFMIVIVDGVKHTTANFGLMHFVLWKQLASWNWHFSGIKNKGQVSLRSNKNKILLVNKRFRTGLKRRQVPNWPQSHSSWNNKLLKIRQRDWLIPSNNWFWSIRTAF